MDQPGPSNAYDPEDGLQVLEIDESPVASSSQAAELSGKVHEVQNQENDSEPIDVEVISENSQSSSDEDEDEPHIAYLKRHEAIRRIMEQETFEPASNWNTNDLAALFSRLRNTNCNQFSVETFLHAFSNTTVEEIMSIIDGLKGVVRDSEEYRVPWKEALQKKLVPTEKAEKIKGDQKEALSQIRQLTKSVVARKKGLVLMCEVLAEALNVMDGRNKKRKRKANGEGKEKVRLSDDILSEACEFVGEVNYEQIYEFLETMTLIKSTKRMRATESAVLLNIFDELEELVDSSFDERVDFMTQFLYELPKLPAADLGWVEFPSNEEMGPKIWNFLDLPQDFLDLSEYVIEQEGGKTTLKK